MKKLLFTIFAVSLLTSCQSKTESPQNVDSCQVATDFLKHYAGNYESISAVDPFVYEPTYGVDFRKFEMLSERLKLNVFFTEDFQKRFREKYSKIENELKKNPQDDGPIEGFEADEFLFTQDYDEILGWIKSGKYKCSASENTAVVSFYPEYALEFQLKDGKIDAMSMKSN
ncbi:hypothetical protein [Flavobacterium sp.]|uniref:hypothetical protein n=1 Tax=Flavobacterium sp. TaxID=239 RepID=UPI00121E4707|nr:hypothetical protein [Flavobacterium sp.]RZJ70408.1 MAG: hypothetical protein EOO49_14095 [Flavobacterium sp.]